MKVNYRKSVVRVSHAINGEEKIIIVSIVSNPVQVSTVHTYPVKELEAVDNKNKITIVGDRKEPSKEAVDQFIKIYLEVIKRLEKEGKIK